MKRIKTNTKPQPKLPMSKNTKIFLYALGGVILLAMIILIMIESASSSITVKYDTEKKLEYVEAYFVDDEGQLTENTMMFEDLNRGKKSVITLNAIDLSELEANLEVRFKFEGEDELFVDAGYFNDEFDGKISISFDDMDDGKILLKVKASAGVIPSPQIRCDEEHIVNLEEGIVEE